NWLGFKSQLHAHVSNQLNDMLKEEEFREWARLTNNISESVDFANAVLELKNYDIQRNQELYNEFKSWEEDLTKSEFEKYLQTQQTLGFEIERYELLYERLREAIIHYYQIDPETSSSTEIQEKAMSTTPHQILFYVLRLADYFKSLGQTSRAFSDLLDE